MVISVDMANAFNSIHRAAMLAVVQQSAAAVLPMVQWAYGDETPLHIVGAPEGTPPVMSQPPPSRGAKRHDHDETRNVKHYKTPLMISMQSTATCEHGFA